MLTNAHSLRPLRMHPEKQEAKIQGQQEEFLTNHPCIKEQAAIFLWHMHGRMERAEDNKLSKWHNSMQSLRELMGLQKENIHTHTHIHRERESCEIQPNAALWIFILLCDPSQQILHPKLSSIMRSTTGRRGTEHWGDSQPPLPEVPPPTPCQL